MINQKHPKLAIKSQCQLLSISRSSVYRQVKDETDYNLELMTLIDKQFLATLFYGVRQMRWHLYTQGYKVNIKRVCRLMRLMGLMPIYQKPNTSKPNKQHRIYPYLLKGMNITEVNHVWCADITYIPMRKGFLYLVAIMDWATRRVLSWRLGAIGVVYKMVEMKIFLGMRRRGARKASGNPHVNEWNYEAGAGGKNAMICDLF